MSWSLRKKKEGIFCNVYFVRKKFFQHLCFISSYGVLNKLSEYIYFYISKTITSCTCLFVFKIVEVLQLIRKSFFNVNRDLFFHTRHATRGQGAGLPFPFLKSEKSVLILGKKGSDFVHLWN